MCATASATACKGITSMFFAGEIACLPKPPAPTLRFSGLVGVLGIQVLGFIIIIILLLHVG